MYLAIETPMNLAMLNAAGLVFTAVISHVLRMLYSTLYYFLLILIVLLECEKNRTRHRRLILNTHISFSRHRYHSETFLGWLRLSLMVVGLP